jgi:hypothetical protein
MVLGVTALHIAQDHGARERGSAPAARSIMKKSPRR